MQTDFTETQLLDPTMAQANSILRKCVHCGFCNSTCPTFTLLGDELDSPRGRIYLIKDLLENEHQPTDRIVQHLDRCLSCLSCMSTCPSGVDYGHLMDTGRAYVEAHYRRRPADRLMRALLAYVLPRPLMLRAAVLFAPLLYLCRPLLPPRLRQAERLLRDRRHGQGHVFRRPVFKVQAARSKETVGLLTGCVQSVLGQDINQASMDILQRHGITVHEFTGCCAAIEQHLGKTAAARRRIVRNLARWQQAGISTLLANASGCGTQLKDYDHIMQHDQQHRISAGQLAARTKDISEYLASRQLNFGHATEKLRVGYHNPCSLQHGQRVREEPIALLKQAGFTVSVIAEPHLCCGSAGTYNILQPALSRQLAERKARLIDALAIDVVATANLGCMLQLQSCVDVPVVHVISLLNWATGGSRPAQLGA